MPKYAYRCTSCGDAFDIQQSFTDDALTVCDRCGGDLRKVFGAVGVAFKGSGFYRNDHGAGAKPAATTSASGSSDGGGAAGAGSSTAPSTPAASPATSGSSTASTPSAT